MALQPKVLLLDEPTAGMNPQESAHFNDFVYRVRDEKGISVLLIEHDMSVIMKISERITVLDRGAMIAEGTPGRHPQQPAGDRGLPRQDRHPGRQAQQDHDGTEYGHRALRRASAARARTSSSTERAERQLRQHRRGQGPVADRLRGRDRHPDRLQRRRQIHHPAHHLRAAAAPLRRRGLQGQQDQRHPRPRGRQARASASPPKVARSSSG